MCGIIGFSGYVKEGQWQETYEMLNALFVECEHRGRHATGFVASTEPYKNPNQVNIVSDKEPIRATDFIDSNRMWRSLRQRRCSTIMGHVRFATPGCPSINSNNHPFQSDELFLIHNGVIRDHHHVAHQNRLKLNTQCDSELLLRIAEQYMDPVDGLKNCLDICRGSMAIVAFDSELKVTYMTRNSGRPLWVMKLQNDSRWFYASTESILLDAKNASLGTERLIELLIPLATDVVYELRPHGQLMAY